MTKPAVAVLGIDLGKNSCSVVGLDETGRVVLRRRLSREGVVRLAADMPACVMAMEAESPTAMGEWLRGLSARAHIDAGSFMRTRARGTPSWPRLDLETGYVGADRSDHLAKSACRQGGPYVFDTSDLRDAIPLMRRGSMPSKSRGGQGDPDGRGYSITMRRWRQSEQAAGRR